MNVTDFAWNALGVAAVVAAAGFTFLIVFACVFLWRISSSALGAESGPNMRPPETCGVGAKLPRPPRGGSSSHPPPAATSGTFTEVNSGAVVAGPWSVARTN